MILKHKHILQLVDKIKYKCWHMYMLVETSYPGALDPNQGFLERKGFLHPAQIQLQSILDPDTTSAVIHEGHPSSGIGYYTLDGAPRVKYIFPLNKKYGCAGSPAVVSGYSVPMAHSTVVFGYLVLYPAIYKVFGWSSAKMSPLHPNAQFLAPIHVNTL